MPPAFFNRARGTRRHFAPKGVFRSSCGDWTCYPGFIPVFGCLPSVFLYFSRLFICSGGFYRDFCVFSSFALQKSVLLRTFAEKGGIFWSLEILFLPDAIKKTRFQAHDHPIYIRFSSVLSYFGICIFARVILRAFLPDSGGFGGHISVISERFFTTVVLR